jgi:hypothetical protein
LLKICSASSDHGRVAEEAPQGRLVPYLAAVLVVAALGFLALRVKDAGSEESAVREVIDRVMLTDAASDCTVLYTQRFLEQIEGKTGAAAVRECRDDADGSPMAGTIEVPHLHLGENRASATVRLGGGEIGGGTMTIRLLRGVSWRLDRLTSVDLDVDRFRLAQARSGINEGIPLREGRCIVNRTLHRIGAAGIERALVTGSSDAMWGHSFGCISDATVRGIIRSSLQKKLVEEGAEPAVASCVAERVGTRVPHRTLRAVLRGRGRQELRDLAREAAQSCTATPTA